MVASDIAMGSVIITSWEGQTQHEDGKQEQKEPPRVVLPHSDFSKFLTQEKKQENY